MVDFSNDDSKNEENSTLEAKSSASSGAEKEVSSSVGQSGQQSAGGDEISQSGDFSNIDWEKLQIDEKALDLVSIESLDKFKFIPFEVHDDFVKVAVVDPDDMNTQNALRFFSRKVRKRLEIYPVDESTFDLLLNKIRNRFIDVESALDVYEKKEAEESKREQTSLRRRKTTTQILKDAPISKMVESIIENAIDSNASDIHIEPLDDSVRVRYRIDGDLRTVVVLPKKIAPALVSRVKILANLKIDEKRKPQDGRFRINDLGRVIDFRVSSFPTANGEKVVLRILDTKEGLMKLEKLGIMPRERKIIEAAIHEPYGIILITGPTGSGKSTTLYSMLRIINKENVNIITLEDPIEYILKGINQSQIRPEIGYTFAYGLRSVLRQDPDIIMVGEIRDQETAELAIHASLTGHLVLSTLHTNSAAGAVPRLIDMGIQPFLLASSLRLLMAQRLVRKICQYCKQPVDDLPKEVQQQIKDDLRLVPKKIFADRGIELDVNDPNSKVVVYKGVGCPKCQGKGMKGRIGIFEVIEADKKFNRLVSKGVLGSELEAEARRNGFITMKEDGLLKVLMGLTTLEEVERVTEDDWTEENNRNDFKAGKVEKREEGEDAQSTSVS